MANHYATLRVPRDAARDEIVRAYRRLARTHHPDVGGDSDRALAATQLDRPQRFRMLWAYGFALPDTGAEVGLARCCRLATTARFGSRLVLRGARSST